MISESSANHQDIIESAGLARYFTQQTGILAESDAHAMGMLMAMWKDAVWNNNMLLEKIKIYEDMNHAHAKRVHP